MRVAFGHQTHVGKTTAAELMQQAFGGQILSFSEPIHKLMKQAYTLIGLPLNGKDRDFMHLVGTTWGRYHIDQNIWINVLLSHMVASNIFVDDLRFLNEALALKQHGFILVKIVSNDAELSSLDHELLNFELWDHIVPNNGSVEDLRKKLTKILTPSYSIADAFLD
jgi:hypothetical protein